MSKNKITNIISLIMNSLVIIFTGLSFIQFFVSFDGDQQFVIGWYSLEYFTVLSNLFVAFTCIPFVVFNILNIKNDTNNFSTVAQIFKYVACVAVGVTALTVIFFLGPKQGFGIMYKSVNLFLHLITPILAIASYCFFEGNPKLKFLVTCFSPITVFVYGTVYLINVLITKTWTDFYGFNANGLWYVSILAMLIAAYAIGVGIYFLTKLISLNNKKG